MSTPTMNLRDLFEEALALAAPARAEFLDAHCGDVAVRARVESMLRASATDDEPVSSARLDGLARAIGDIPALPPAGSRIGPFEIVRVIGEGGSSTVFEAHREIEGASQRVALKLLRQSLLSPDARRRFGREQRALIHLQQPNIARMIEGGVTQSGQAYIALELVHGQPITAYADSEKLGVRERLGLFMTVCKAVDAAHRALIVHRDIKPSNVLVTADGEVKLLDFGIAKLLADESEPDATLLPAFTPAYAAPEQFDGGVITTATDVYALGIVLGELLTGVRAGQGVSRTPSGPNGAESSVMFGPVTRRRLRGDLDAVVTKAIEPDPERRYTSAGALADDIERILDNRPVRAQPQTRLYRMRKFVVRHRGGVATTVAFLLAILASLGIALWQARVARQQAGRAAQVQAFVEDLFQPLEKGSSTKVAPTLVELLQRGRDRIDQRYPGDSDVRADLLAMFARIGDVLGETHSNLALARAAVRANKITYGERDARTIDAREIYARGLRKVGDYVSARAELDGVRASLRSGDMPAQSHAQLLDALGALGKDTGQPPAEVIALERDALTIREGDPVASLDDLATGYNNLGAAYQYANDDAQAMPWLEKAYSTYYADRGDSLSAASTLLNLGTIQTDTGQWSAAAARYREAHAMFARIPIASHPTLASLLLWHCGGLLDMELLDEADRICTEADAMVLELQGREHRQYVSVLQRRARLHLAHGQVAQAHADFEDARALARHIENASDRALVLTSTDAAQSRDWWLERNFPALRDATLAILSSTNPRFGANTIGGFYYASLAALACRRAPAPACGGDRVAAAAQVLADPALRGHALRLPSLIALAEADAGTAGIAAPALEQALAEAASSYGPRHSIQVQVHRVLATLREDAGEPAAAAAHAAQAEQAARALPIGHPLRTRSGS